MGSRTDAKGYVIGRNLKYDFNIVKVIVFGVNLLTKIC